MAIVGHVWAVLVNLIAVGVILAMFGVAETRFETVVVSALTLIYITTTSAFMVQNRMTAQLAQSWSAGLAHLAKLLNDPESQVLDEALKETADKLRKGTVRFYIHLAFHTLVWGLALWKLVGAI
jgi:hypothetical protein